MVYFYIEIIEDISNHLTITKIDRNKGFKAPREIAAFTPGSGKRMHVDKITGS